MSSTAFDFSAVKAAARSHWADILTMHGLQLPSSGKRHCPCPVCGGTDRFRFDDKGGHGTWFCNHCEPHSGDGFNLLANFTGKKLGETLALVAGYLGLSTSHGMDKDELTRIRRQAVEREQQRQRIEQAGHQAAAELAELMVVEALEADAARVPYLASKGFGGFPVLTLSRDYTHTINGQSYVYRKGSLLVEAMNGNGEITTAEIISQSGKYAIAGGIKKGSFAVVEPLTADGQPDDATHYAISEGYATALSVRALLGGNALVFAGLSKAGLMDAATTMRQRFPNAVIVVWGDTGAEPEANAAAETVGASTTFPPEGFGDWDDYRQAQDRGEVAA